MRSRAWDHKRHIPVSSQLWSSRQLGGDLVICFGPSLRWSFCVLFGWSSRYNSSLVQGPGNEDLVLDGHLWAGMKLQNRCFRWQNYQSQAWGLCSLGTKINQQLICLPYHTPSRQNDEVTHAEIELFRYLKNQEVGLNVWGFICSGSYLIFVASINSSASVKFIDWGEFFSQPTRKGLLTVYICTQCVISHTMCHFTHCV